jgi:predicted MFS family arabinose efflux permease
MIVGAGAAGLAWLGVFFTPHLYGSLLGGVIIINIFMVIASTAVGGYMVEAAQASAASGRLTALREFVQQVCLMIRGPLGGFLASVAFGWTAGACGLVVLLLVPTAAFFLFEKRLTVRSDEILSAASTQFVRIVNARTMWAAAGLTALFYIAPGVNTAVFYIQQNVLHFNTQQQGMLLLYYGIAGVIAALIYSWACRRVNLRSLLIICLLAATASNASYLFYTTPFNAQVINALDGFCYTLAELVMMDLAIRATPAGSESLGFSLMVSVRNFALFGTDLLGSYLMDTYHLPFNTLVMLNAGFTLIAAPLSLLLPRLLVMRKDAEVHEDAAMPRSAMQD